MFDDEDEEEEKIGGRDQERRRRNSIANQDSDAMEKRMRNTGPIIIDENDDDSLGERPQTGKSKATNFEDNNDDLFAGLDDLQPRDPVNSKYIE